MNILKIKNLDSPENKNDFNLIDEEEEEEEEEEENEQLTERLTERQSVKNKILENKNNIKDLILDSERENKSTNEKNTQEKTENSKIDSEFSEISSNVITPQNDVNNNNNNSDSESSENNTSEFLYFLNEKNEIVSKFKIINLTCAFINFVYECIYIYVNISSQKIKKNFLVDKMFNISIFYLNSSNITSSNCKIKLNRTITEKEISLLKSHSFILSKIFDIFIKIFPNEKITNIFKEIDNNCKNGIFQLLNQINFEFFDELNNINFKNYPTFQKKNLNDYIKKFNNLFKLYENVKFCFTKEEIIKLFKDEFFLIFEKFQKIVENKGMIIDEIQLKQFRYEMKYVQKIIKNFDYINTKIYNEKIEEIFKYVNPNKNNLKNNVNNK
jgi:hypothetical protein